MWGRKKKQENVLELSETLPKEYEERMLSSSLDCVDGDLTKASGDACHAVGEFWAVVKNDHAKARDFYERNCEARGHSPSCFNLGRLLLGGRGGDVDEKGALKLFKRVCDDSYSPGCHHFGLLSIKLGDKNTGRKALGKACDLRDAESCYIVGSNLIKIAKPKTPEEKAQETLYARYFRPRGEWDKRDVKRAQTCLEIACQEGHAPACEFTFFSFFWSHSFALSVGHNLAVLFKHGDDGVPADDAKFQAYAEKTTSLIQQRGAAQGFNAS